MAVSCPPKVEPEDTQNKAQFGSLIIAGEWDLTAYGIVFRETGHWLYGSTVTSLV
jgi:hypothetical protein